MKCWEEEWNRGELIMKVLFVLYVWLAKRTAQMKGAKKDESWVSEIVADVICRPNHYV